MEECIFCNIRDRKIPSNIIYEDEYVMVFPDIHPVKPVHLLIVPKAHVEDFLTLSQDDLWNNLRTVIQRMVKEKELEGKGYRLTVNGGGAQIVNHLHIHLMGPMGKMAKL